MKLDFLSINAEIDKKGLVVISPDFIVMRSKDLMIRGGDFYAIWDEELGQWSTDEARAIEIIDTAMKQYAEDNQDRFTNGYRILYLRNSKSGSIKFWHNYCRQDMFDNYHNLDEKILFSNDKVNKKDYSSKRLTYPLEKCDIPNYNHLMETIYSPEEREKIEWAIGSIVTGDSKKIQKFLVLYGSAGTGKSTVLNIIQKLFDGYYSVFDAKALGSTNSPFALEAFRSNPLVAIQHDGDLSRIEDNTTLNSLVSHEYMRVNEKFKATYTSNFKAFLFMGTNKPVRITDAKSGILRRLIDVSPTGEKLSPSEYRKVTKGIDFELGGIAEHCKQVYLSDPGRYDDYVPINMMNATNDFYNFMLDSYFIFKEEDSTSLKSAWDLYNEYCKNARVPYPMSQRAFKEELKNYFREYSERGYANGTRVRNLYSGLRLDKFENEKQTNKKEDKTIKDTLVFSEQRSLLDDLLSDCPAQYGNSDDIPQYKWINVRTKLRDLSTDRLHYVKVPENHIVIDFDIPDENGNKSFEKNLEEANKWPKTYAELSKSGQGIHLHYIYTGDVSKLSRIYDEHIEVKVFTGNSSLRRKVSKCNNIPVANISSGLPLKGENNVANFEALKNEKALRTLIKKNLNKDIHPNTKPSMDFIKKILDDAYNGGMIYDVTDMKNEIVAFAASSTHNSDYCLKLIGTMHFRSEERSTVSETEKDELVFYDIEVYPNLFLICYKFEGPDKPVIRMFNPTRSEVEEFMKFKLVGFNCRRYDNHILMGRYYGYSNEELFKLSGRIVGGSKNAFFGEAYNLSYTDVYDFCSKKQSLKKWEIELGIHHQEMGIPWDKPAPTDMWDKIAEYCDNDVIATEAVFHARQADFTARKIQVELVKNLHGINDISVNDTTNTLSTKIIFGKNREPQSQFNYRNLAEPVPYTRYGELIERFGYDYKFRIFDQDGLPTYREYDGREVLPDGYSILPFFPGYTYDAGKSFYLGQEIGEGGRVYSEPGMYVDIWDGDVSSMHPHSIIYEALFGPEYTKRFKDIVDARVAIKHKDFKAASKMLGGVLKPYLNEAQADDLAQALKIVINSIYGLTSATFINPFRDINNKDNIVAKRGALFMTLLKREVEKMGYKVAHIKTDSIKIPNADAKIQDFILKFGQEYGYSFETEAEFGRFCLVNDAVYVARYKKPKKNKKTGEEIWWTATGTQFQVPYVFKKLFSHEEIEFADMCETKSVQTSLYLDMNEGLPEGQHDYNFVGKIGLFCPMVPGAGGGVLLREKDGKYYAATGSKGYVWMESEMVQNLNKYSQINRAYYDKLVDEAVETISKYGDFEWFVNNDSVISDPLPESLNL